MLQASVSFALCFTRSLRCCDWTAFTVFVFISVLALGTVTELRMCCHIWSSSSYVKLQFLNCSHFLNTNKLILWIHALSSCICFWICTCEVQSEWVCLIPNNYVNLNNSHTKLKFRKSAGVLEVPGCWPVYLCVCQEKYRECMPLIKVTKNVVVC